MLRRSLPQIVSVKDFPPFRLDPINQCLLRLDSAGNEQRIELKPKSFDVLHYLVDNPGRLITHDELLEAVWRDAEVQQEVLKGQILTLRKALGDTAEEPRYILTLRKRGYKFIASVGFDEAFSKLSRSRCGKFVDRARPMSELREALRLARNCVPRLVFVTGEPGIGRTELVERFLEESRADDATAVTIGRCIEGYGGIEPYYPVLEALGGLIRQRDGEVVVRALKETAPTWALQMPGLLSGQARALLQRQIAPSSRDRMVREFCQMLDELAERRTLVIVLEDLHWSDRSNRGHFVGLRPPGRPRARIDRGDLPARRCRRRQSSHTYPQPRVVGSQDRHLREPAAPAGACGHRVCFQHRHRCGSAAAR